MANNYGIVSTANTPSQETVDGFLNWCDANPPEIDVEGLTEEAKEAVRKQLEEIREEAKKKLDAMTKGVKEKLVAMEALFKPLSTPPADIDAVVGWLKNLADFFKQPYDAIVDAIAWWPKFIASATAAVSGTVARSTAQVAKLTTAAASASSAASAVV